MDKALAQLCGQDHKQGPLAAEADCGPEWYGAVRSAVTSVTAQVLSDFETGSRSPWGVIHDGRSCYMWVLFSFLSQVDIIWYLWMF